MKHLVTLVVSFLLIFSYAIDKSKARFKISKTCVSSHSVCVKLKNASSRLGSKVQRSVCNTCEDSCGGISCSESWCNDYISQCKKARKRLRRAKETKWNYRSKTCAAARSACRFGPSNMTKKIGPGYIHQQFKNV